ncbi:MAG: RidA family protein [Longimicrobiales bacterium]
MRVTRVLTTLAFAALALSGAGAVWLSVGTGPVALAAQEQQQEDIEYIGGGRFLSSAVRVGRTLYLSGQLGLGGERGITPETRAALENIKELLEDNGATMDDVIKCTVFLADFAEWGAMNDVYVTYFTKHRPARSAVAVSGMAANARVEIECMAVIGARNAVGPTS